MQTLDDQAYGWHGFPGALLCDGGRRYLRAAVERC
jgi:hypothetical protein